MKRPSDIPKMRRFAFGSRGAYPAEMEISAITFTLPQAATPVPDAATNGLFLAVMGELGAWSPQENVEPPTTFTLLNPNSLTSASPFEDETADVQLDNPDATERLLTIVVPPSTQPLPVAPLAMNLALVVNRLIESTEERDVHAGSKSSPWQWQAAPAGEQNTTEKAVPIERGGRVLKGELAFAARVSKQGEVPQTIAVQPKAQPQIELAGPVKPVQPDKQDKPEAGNDGRLPQPIENVSDPIERTTEALDPVPEIKTHQWNAPMPTAVSNKNQAAQETPKVHHVEIAPRVVDVEAPLQARATEPVREVAIAIDGAEGRVRLRMETHSGELRAWVTGSSPETVERVRAELPDLARSLRDSGFKSELWTPNSVKQAGAVSELHAGLEHGQRSFGAEDHQDDGSRRRRPQPDWLETEDE